VAAKRAARVTAEATTPWRPGEAAATQPTMPAASTAEAGCRSWAMPQAAEVSDCAPRAWEAARPRPRAEAETPSLQVEEATPWSLVEESAWPWAGASATPTAASATVGEARPWPLAVAGMPWHPAAGAMPRAAAVLDCAPRAWEAVRPRPRAAAETPSLQVEEVTPWSLVEESAWPWAGANATPTPTPASATVGEARPWSLAVAGMPWHPAAGAMPRAAAVLDCAPRAWEAARTRPRAEAATPYRRCQRSVHLGTGHLGKRQRAHWEAEGLPWCQEAAGWPW